MGPRQIEQKVGRVEWFGRDGPLEFPDDSRGLNVGRPLQEPGGQTYGVKIHPEQNTATGSWT